MNRLDVIDTPVREALAADLLGIVRVHQQAFPRNLMTMLGPRFLQVYYQTVLDYSERIFLVTRDGSGSVTGFVAGFAHPSGFYRLFSGRKRRAMLSAALHVLARPALWYRVIDNMRSVEQRSSESAQAHKIRAEIASIGVRPGSKGLGSALVQSFIEASRQKSVKIVELTTDANNNDVVNRFYQKLGFKVSKESIRGKYRVMNHYEFDLC